MNVTNERNKDMVEYDLDLSKDEAKILATMGLALIQKDENELINYAVNHILMDMIKNTENSNEKLKQAIGKMTNKALIKKQTETVATESKKGRPRKEKV
jgi:hypothetical protein